MLDNRLAEKRNFPTLIGTPVKQPAPLQMTWHEVEDHGIGRILGQNPFRLSKGTDPLNLDPRGGDPRHHPRQELGSVNNQESRHLPPAPEIQQDPFLIGIKDSSRPSGRPE